MSFISAMEKNFIAPAMRNVFKPKIIKNSSARVLSDTHPAHTIVLDKAFTKPSTALTGGKTFSYFTEVAYLLQQQSSRLGKVIQRFRKDEIFKLAPIMNQEPKIVKELLSCTYKNRFGEINYRFNAYTIEKLVPIVKKYPEIARKFIQETKISGEPKYMPQDIIQLCPLMNDNPNLVKELLNVSTERLGDLIPRFKADEVVSLVPVMKKNPEIVRELIKEKAISCNGHVIDRFSAIDIEKFVPVIKKEPNFKKYISATEINENGKIVPKYNRHFLNYVSENIQGISKIKDEKVISEIEKLINEGKYKDADALIDAMNNISGNYSTIYGSYFSTCLNQESERTLLFSKYLKSQGLSLEKLNKGEITDELSKNLEWKGLNTEILSKDFELDCKYQRMAEFMKKNPDNEISNYLYENYYLKELENIGIKPSVIEKCKVINQKYNVKIMPSTDSRVPIKAIKSVETELEKWISASKGDAKLPPIIDFSTAKSNWYDSTSAYGKSASGAYSEGRYNGAISFNRMTKNSVEYAMRHEMVHTNDMTETGYKIPQEYNMDDIMPHYIEEKQGRKIQINQAEKGIYYQEFKNAGLSDHKINYAYNNHKEFIAVASEGDMSKYSPEFKKVLIDFGMPEWVFNIA